MLVRSVPGRPVRVGAAALIALAVIAPQAASLGPASAQTPLALIAGSGATSAASGVSTFVADATTDGLQVVYTADGTAAAKHDFADDTTDFAVLDVPYLGKDKVTGTVDSSDGREYGDIPFVAQATTFPFNIHVGGHLLPTIRLSGRTLAGIFTNTITNWNDPAITRDNDGVVMPSLRIVPVVHSEGSAVSYEFSTYLADEYPKLWRSFGGEPGPTQYWPRQGHQVAENGSDGVINFVGSANGNGAIGMDELAYALGKDLPVAAVENKAGYFVTPTQYDAAIALRSATVDETPSSPDYMRPDLRKVIESTDRRAYPLSSYSSMLIPTSSTDSRMTPAKRQTLADFAYFGICSEQSSVGALGYAPLPINLVRAGLKQIARLHAADPSVVVNEFNVSNCRNPTFVAANPKLNYLSSIAPYPGHCARSGAGPCFGPQTETAHLSIAASKRQVRPGGSSTLSGTLEFRGTDTFRIRAAVDLQRRIAHGSWRTIRTVTTSVTGALHVHLHPSATAAYRLVRRAPFKPDCVTSRTVEIALNSA